MNRALPSLNALRAFEAVARHLHYPAAAAELNVSPAAVKQLVAKLESAVGRPLLERKGRGLTLTQAGLASQRDLTAAMDLLNSSVNRMRTSPEAERLIVSVESSLATIWLVPKLEEFRSRHPEVTVLIDSSQEVVDLHRSDVDVAIRYGVRRKPHLIAQRLFDDQFFPACSPSLASSFPGMIQLADLARFPLIHWDLSKLPWARTTSKWFSWENWLAHNDADLSNTNEGLYFSDYGLAVQAAIAGQGVVLASWPILNNVISAGLLVQPFKETVNTDIGYDIVTTESNRERWQVEAFIAWVLEAASLT